MNLTKQSPHQTRVSLFMAKMKSDKQPTPTTPQEPTPDVRVLRAKLQAEECLETIQQGLGVSMRIKVPSALADIRNGLLTLLVMIPSGSEARNLAESIVNMSKQDNLRDINYDEIEFTADRQFDMIETIDGLADCSVVNIGTAITCGVGMEPIQEIVDCNNMAKFGPGHSFNAAGKLIKPKDHTPPTEEINLELRRQGWEGPKPQLKTPYTEPTHENPALKVGKTADTVPPPSAPYMH